MSNIPTFENKNDFLRQLFEDIEGLQDVLSDLVDEAEKDEAKAIETLTELRNAMRSLLSRWLIPTRRRNPVSCELPHHSHSIGIRWYQCKKNSNHVFCKRHKLDQCVKCGGDLK